MKTIGLVGGTSWQSTAEYYRIINKTVGNELGGHHSAKIIMSSIDYDPIPKLAHQKDWKGVENILVREARRLEESGADFFLLCANTLHKVAENVAGAVNIPLLHIVDATAKEIKKSGLEKLGLLGTRFTMEDGFYQKTLSKYGIETMIPDESDRAEIHHIIFDELTIGIISDKSLNKYTKVIESLAKSGAQGVILGCTEIPLLIQEEHVTVPIFDTTKIHSVAAAEMAMKG
jgi:aspartate racemase